MADLVLIIEKTSKFNVKMLMYSVDYKKVFDKVKWSKFWNTLVDMETPKHLVSPTNLEV